MPQSINFSHAKKKLHCRYTPSWQKGKPTRRWLRRVYALLERHRWADNSAIKAMRKSGYTIQVPGRFSITKVSPRSRRMRQEREVLMQQAALCMSYFVNLDPFAPGLFEVDCSISTIARFIGVYHEYEPGYDADREQGQYRHGRIAYCRLLRCLCDMEQAGLIVVAREYDPQQAQYKASRVFLTPVFFKTIGMSLKQVGEYLVAEEKRLRKKGLSQNYQKRMEKQERLLGSGSVASVERISLKNLLTKYRDQFFHEAGVRPTIKSSDKYDTPVTGTKPENRTNSTAAQGADEIYDLQCRFSNLCYKANVDSSIFAWQMKSKIPNLPPGSREFYQYLISELRRRLVTH